jgi:hypothetical protein
LNPARCAWSRRFPARVKFSVTRPALSRDQEAALIDVLREILTDEGKL